MPSVTSAFARAMAQAAGMTLTEDGALVSGGAVVRRLAQPTAGRLADTDYFDLLDWIRREHDDEVALLEAYAGLIPVDDIGVLGLAMKTAPTLRASLERLERYWLVVTDTAVYRLDASGDPALLVFEARTDHHPVLDFRNEAALAGSAHNMRLFVEGELVLDHVSFRHTCRSDPDRYAAHFECPVIFEAERDAIALKPAMLDLPNRLGDAAVSEFLTAHLETEIGPLRDDPTLRAALLRRLMPALSNGVPQAADVAREIELGTVLKLGRSEMLSGGRRKLALLGDAMEAVIAAVYVDAGYEAARAMVLRLWGGRIGAVKQDARDAKTALQEWAQARGLPPPDYVETARSGPDHAPVFTIEARLQSGEQASATAGSKRQAEQAAARALLDRLESQT